MKRLVRAIRVVCVTAMILAVLLFSSVQIQQRMLRWRAERLSADMHQIRLYQSTWTDAQQLMHRWGEWGHYDGSCTAIDCKYEIEMGSIDHYAPGVPRHVWLEWLLKHDRVNIYEWFGGRVSAFHAAFTVHDGTIWRESSWIGVSVPERKIRREKEFEWSLSIGAQSYQRLHGTLKSPSGFVGGIEGLAGHPYYKVGRPSGCMINCQIEVAYYSTRTPPAEIERLTSYNFSCFTRFKPCAHIEELLPAASEWHLYDNENESSPTVPVPPALVAPAASKPPPLTLSCSTIPAWAMARDARYVLAVEALSTKTEKTHEDYGEYHREVAKVRVLSSLKEPAPWLPGAIVSAHLINWLDDAVPSGETERLIPGKRYIVFAIGNDQRDQIVTKNSPISFERCGVQEDCSEIRRELEKGFAQNDTLAP